jgi:2-polyprenyl-3-methyl-5-hydroxy-6-metoxy-1,4-benzoquinol methylase
MRLIKLDPPGTLCSYESLRDLVKKTKARTFVDIGCGGGNVSKLLCSTGMTGIGIEFSRLAIEQSRQTLRDEIEAGRYVLIEEDVTALAREVPPSEMGVSFMVMEHIEDDEAFVRVACNLVRPGGYLAIWVPARRDHWSLEDQTVGHLRRYDKEDLRCVLEAGGLREVEIWSVAVPTANILFHISEWLIRRSDETKKAGLSLREQTESSGLREIPWKTVFPPWVKVVLNRYTLYPLFLLQRLFYRTGVGLIMVGFGRVPD